MVLHLNYYLKLSITIIIFIIAVIKGYSELSESFCVGSVKPQLSPYVIPKTIIQTYHDKSKIPTKVYKNIRRFSPGYRHIIFDDPECIAFIRKYYNENLVKIFQSLGGAHRADLFRYCYLYQFGGFYLDIKIEMIRPMRDLYTLLSKHNVKLTSVLSIHRQTIFQGFIGSVPKNPIFLDLIQFITDNFKKCKRDYLILTRDFYNQVKKLGGRPTQGNNSDTNVFFFKESCDSEPTQCYDGLDRHGLCCFVNYDGEKFLKTRYSDYPWK